jgi:hypothetical protein
MTVPLAHFRRCHDEHMTQKDKGASQEAPSALELTLG